MDEFLLAASDRHAHLKLWLTTTEPDLWAKFSDHGFEGTIRVSTIGVGSPASFFADMAQDWRGWTGEKSWSDLEERLVLVATTDSLGHVSISITLRDASYDTHIETTLIVNAGELDGLAQRCSRLVPQCAS